MLSGIEIFNFFVADHLKEKCTRIARIWRIVVQTGANLAVL